MGSYVLTKARKVALRKAQEKAWALRRKARAMKTEQATNALIQNILVTAPTKIGPSQKSRKMVESAAAAVAKDKKLAAAQRALIRKNKILKKTPISDTPNINKIMKQIESKARKEKALSKGIQNIKRKRGALRH
jgi:hypothetical protein